MLGGDYLKFNGVIFPRPISPSRTSKTIENVNQSEAGTDLITIVRTSKNSWNFTFNLTSRTRDFLLSLCSDESTVMLYQGVSYNVRVRDFNEKFVDGSEWIDRTNGLFVCSVKVTEF